MKRWEEQGRGKVEASGQEEKQFLLKEVEKEEPSKLSILVRALLMDVVSKWYKCSDGLG